MTAESCERVAVVGDSLALPRVNSTDSLLWDETWPARLECELISRRISAKVINFSRRLRTVDTIALQDFDECIGWVRPSIVVIQIGIVDCAPRIFTRRNKRLLQSRFVPKVIRNWVIGHRSKNRARLIRKNPLGRVYTPPLKFAHYGYLFVERLRQLDFQPKLIVLPIVCGSHLELKSPGIMANVNMYNSMLKDVCEKCGGSWIDPTLLLPAPSEGYLFPDGIHLNLHGSMRYSRVVSDVIARLCGSNELSESALTH